MTHAVIHELKGIGQENYEAVKSRIGLDEDPPEGLIIHAAGATDGGCRILELWETPEHCQRFETERLVPVTAQYQQEVNLTPEVTHVQWECTSVLLPGISAST
jgi:hypothetical protein